MEEKSSNAESHQNNKNLSELGGLIQKDEIEKIKEIISMCNIQNQGVLNLNFILSQNIGNLSETNKIEGVEEVKPLVKKPSRLAGYWKKFSDAGLMIIFKRIVDTIMDHRCKLMFIVERYFNGASDHKTLIIISIVTIIFNFGKWLGSLNKIM